MIRHATIHDYNDVIDMLIEFGRESGEPYYQNPEYRLHGVKNRLALMQQSGCVFLSVDEHDKPTGMLLATITNDMWLPEIRILREVAWWVYPEYRGGSAGYRLFKAYQKFGQAMLDAGDVEQVVITLLNDSPDIDLHKRGWRVVEANYVLKGDR